MSINERKGRANGQKDSEADASQKDNVVMETALNSDGNGGSSKFIVRGHIIDKPSGKAASDVRVQAFVKHKESNFCPEGDSTQSDAEGFYQIEFDAATFKENDLECDGPILVVKAYNQKDSLIGKSKSVRIVNRETELNVDVTLYRVDVSVLDVNNKPVPKIIVKAFDRDLRKPQPLGECETNEQGKCYIDYSLVDFQKGDLSSNKTPWLIVEARKEPDGAVLVSQEFRKSESIQKVNLVVTIPGTTISEWQRLNNIIPPLLKGQGTPPSTGSQSEADSVASLLKGQCTPDSQSEGDPDLEPFDLTSTDIDFIVLETELDRAAVEAWVASSRIVRDAILLLTDAHPCEQAIIREQGWPFFYSFARQGFANDLEAVLRESATKWERAWRAALSNDQVPPLDEEHLKQLVTILELLQRLRLLDPVQSRDSSIVQVLAQTPLPAAVALDALTIFQERGLGDTAAFLKLIDSHPNAETDIKIFVRGVRVHQLVSGHAGLSRLLNSHLDNTNGSDTSSCCFVSKLFGSSTNFELDSIGPLALLPSTEWITLGEKASVSQSLTLRLQAKVEGMYPLTALQTRITKEDVQFPVPGSEIITFIKKNEETAESILSGSFPLKHLNSNETPVIYRTLSNVGLFQRFGLNMETSAHLMGKGITSVGIAVSFGREAVRDAVGDLHPSEVAIEFAEYLVGKAEEYLNSFNKFLTTAGYEGNVALPWYQDKALVMPAVVKENLPDLTSIFGDLDQCFCNPCESMLSQSAYLVDLLQLLKKIPNAFGELSKRRGDIPKDLLLSCESEAEIQHIVLVLGILEKAISETSSETVAYQRTASAVFPWRLPFDRYYAETKAYLAKLNVTRQDFLVLQSAVNEQYLAAETLSIAMPQPSVSGSISEWELITQAREQDALWHTYGFSPNNGRVSIVDPVSSEELIDQPVQGVIKRISVLLDRTGLSLDELERILTTKYVLIPAGELFISNREQCKTSEMRLAVEEDRLEATLDRLHRFIRLHAKLPEWSFEQLDRAIEVTGDVLNDATVIKLAVIERLRKRHALSLEYLLGLPEIENKLRQELELSAQQYILVKAMTGLDLSVKPTDWNILEKLCVTLSRLSESGLSVEQVAAAVLPRITLDTLGQNHLPSVKTEEQIEEMLSSLQQRLQSVEAIRSDIQIEAQVVGILTAIFGAEDANKVMKAIDMAGNPKDPQNHPNLNSLVQLLSGPEHATHILGDWLLLFSADQAKKILTVDATTTNNPTINARFEMLLNDIAPRRRERELVAVIAEQCKLPDLDVVACLSFRLLLDPVWDAANQKATETAAELFLDESYWTKDSQRLRDWMDRLHRLVAFSAALNFNSELMQLADRVVVGNRTGINWRNILATAKAVDGDDCVALLDLLWLQRAEQLSKVVLYDLFDQLKNSSNPIQPEVLRSLATRVGISAEQTLAIATQAISPLNADNLRNPHQLRRVFELLLKARYLGADGTPLQQLANLADNVQSANAALTLLQARTDKEKWQEVLQKTRDPLLQQRRDALVAYLMHHNEQTADPLHQQRSANDLYEYYLIDPQIEPCLITTRLLEAITATQLFVQRVLFGLEAEIHTSDESIKQQWTWMRNYRVWEANRKVFLFPENWLFPELRDDKSSSFKQLESALGQSELTQELAQQSFGQFLDDVAQIGQIYVLGMYEDVDRMVNHKVNNRDLYLIGRTINPPYTYFWRRCIDFGDERMEWQPWQRIELDIQGDHVLIFLLKNDFYIAWPVFKHPDEGTKDEPKWEISFSCCRLQGNKWSRVEKFRDKQIVSAKAFQDERDGFAFRCTVQEEIAEIICYSRALASGLSMDLPDEFGDDILKDMPLDSLLSKSFISSCKSLLNACISYSQLSYLGSHIHIGDPVLKLGDRKINDGILGGALYFNWECWVKAKDDEGRVGYVKLRSGGGYYSLTLTIRIGNQEITAWPETILIWAVLLNFTDPNLPSINIKAKLFIRNKYYYSAEKAIDPIENRKMRSISLNRFEINTSDFDIPKLSELGIEASKIFEPVAKFFIKSNGQTFWESTISDEVLSQLEYCKIFMNGYQEDSNFNPLSLPGDNPSTKLSPFVSPNSNAPVFISSSTKYWLVGASSKNPIDKNVSNIWYFREDSTACLIDTYLPCKSPYEKFSVYAAGYPEALEYRYAWMNSEKLFSESYYQERSFSANDFPCCLNVPGDKEFWQGQLDGKFTFDARLPYACYNWEVFFHAPLLIADQLSKQLKFMDAEQWLRYVFDPTSGEPGTDPKRFFKFRVFRDLDLGKQVIDDLTALAQAARGGATNADISTINGLIDRWRNAPFRPFLIARRRSIAFLWRTLFAYLDNLIAWADSLYRQDRRESINEATMLYVLAERILGRRPQQHQGKSKRIALSFNEVEEKYWDNFANYWVNAVTRTSIDSPQQPFSDNPPKNPDKPQPNPNGMLYFCMPFNDKISTYWNIIDERLFNLRHCRNIEGIERSLPFTDVPIDPELLIRATAAGLDLGDMISGLYAPPPHYRYTIFSARAAELANEVKSLGAAMLSAIEKRDAEQIAQLRSSNEIDLLRLVREVRILQITEADRNLDALRATRESTGNRYNQYQRLLGKKGIKVPKEHESTGDESMLGNVDGIASERSSWGLIKEENEQYTGIEGANTWSIAAGISKATAGVAHAAAVYLPAKPVSEAIGHAGSVIGDGFSIVSQAWRAYAEKQGMEAGHIRRRDEWAFQSNQTLKELQQIDKQILANEIRIDITSKELSNQIEQIEQAKAVDEVMRSKFSNEQLYQWMISQLSGLYFNTYRMALDMARRAERAAERELGVKSLNILRNDYWDSLRVGLLAGERLHLDIKRLEAAYLDQNRREYELTKHISLRRLNPGALVNLRIKDAEGHCSCTFDIPEWLFDLDTPGHYLRRIKSVSVSIPCVAGPYTNVSCKLTLLKSSVRFDRTADNYSRSGEGDDPHFTYYFGASEAIVTSTGNADSGMFDPQLKDERFLTFESSGVISSWRLELPAEYPQFDYSTISDVILTIRYTARDGGDSLRKAATAAIAEKLVLPQTTTPKVPLRSVLLSCRSDFSTEWAKARNTDAALKIQIKNDLLPYWMEAAKLKVQEVSYADLFKESTEPLHFKSVWSRPPETVSTDVSNTPATIDVGEVDLGKLVGDVTDRLVLLWVGGKQT